MSDTKFEAGSVIAATWLNEVNDHVYKDEGPGDSSTAHNSDSISFTQSGSGAISQSVSFWMKGKVRSIFDFIPPALHDAIRAGTDTTDLISYVEAAYANTPLIEWGPGVFHMSRGPDLTGYTNGIAIVGSGQSSGPSFFGYGTKIIITGDNAPGFRITRGCHVEGFYAEYENQQDLSDTSAILLELLNVNRATFRNLRLFKANTLIGMRQGVTNGSFASKFENLDLNQASLTFLDLRSVSGGSTNSRISNLYLNGGGSLDFATAGQAASYGIRTASWSGLEVGAVSIDGLPFTERLWDSSNDYIDIDTIRAEAVQCKKDGDGWFGFGGSDSDVRINKLIVEGSRALLADVPSATYLLRTNATRNVLRVGSVSIDTNANSSYTAALFRPLLDGSTTRYIRIGRIYDPSAYMNDSWSGTDHAGVFEFGGKETIEEIRAGRATTSAFRKGCTAASLPASGATGDRAEIVNPGDLGRPYQAVYFGSFIPSAFVGGQFSVSTVDSDEDFTLTPGTSRPVTYHTGTLTAARAVTLSTEGAWNGAIFRIARTGSGEFNLNVGTGPLKALTTGTWADFIYDGSAWRLMASGSL